MGANHVVLLALDDGRAAVWRDRRGGNVDVLCRATLPSDGCAADVDGSGAVDVGDLVAVLGAWGPCPGCAEDIDGDDLVGVSDLLEVRPLPRPRGARSTLSVRGEFQPRRPPRGVRSLSG